MSIFSTIALESSGLCDPRSPSTELNQFASFCYNGVKSMKKERALLPFNFVTIACLLSKKVNKLHSFSVPVFGWPKTDQLTVGNDLHHGGKVTILHLTLVYKITVLGKTQLYRVTSVRTYPCFCTQRAAGKTVARNLPKDRISQQEDLLFDPN